MHYVCVSLKYCLSGMLELCNAFVQDVSAVKIVDTHFADKSCSNFRASPAAPFTSDRSCLSVRFSDYFHLDG
jgi:hypothetical protein